MLITTAVIGLEFIVNASYAAEVLAGVWASAIIGGATATAAEVNASGSAAVITALELASPALSKEPILCW